MVLACLICWGLPSSYGMLFIGLWSDVQVVVCQYVVFILELILSYLPVHLTSSLPSSPRSLLANVEKLSSCGEQCLGLRVGGCQMYVTGKVGIGEVVPRPLDSVVTNK